MNRGASNPEPSFANMVGMSPMGLSSVAGTLWARATDEPSVSGPRLSVLIKRTTIENDGGYDGEGRGGKGSGVSGMRGADRIAMYVFHVRRRALFYFCVRGCSGPAPFPSRQ